MGRGAGAPDRRAHALAELRALAGGHGTAPARRVGLREGLAALQAFTTTGQWPASVLAAMSPEMVDPTPADNHGAEPEETAAQAVARHFPGPELRLTVAARRRGQAGLFVVLDERACFLRLGLGRWQLEEDYAYEDVVDPRIDSERPGILRFEHGGVLERVEMTPEDAVSTLATLRAARVSSSE